MQYLGEINFTGPDIHQLPGYQLNEYRIIITPPENITYRIMKLRSSFNEKYDPEFPLSGIPEIILANFSQIKASEERIINRLRIIAMALQPVKIIFNDFGSFPSHSIFLDISNKSPLEYIARKIKIDAQRLLKLDGYKPYFMTDAHLSIANRLKPGQFEKAWAEYSEKQFTAKFIASRILLLRRRNVDLNFSPVANFDFMNLPVDIKQGTLF